MLLKLLETCRKIISKREKCCKRLDESKAREGTDSLKTEGRENKKARWESVVLWESTEAKQVVHQRQSSDFKKLRIH